MHSINSLQDVKLLGKNQGKNEEQERERKGGREKEHF